MEILGTVDVPVHMILAITAVVLLYIRSTWNHNFFRKQNIPGPKPYPIIGNTFGRGLMRHFHEWKQTYGNVFGVFMGREPVFVICDLDILKDVLVKSFNNFRNRRAAEANVNPSLKFTLESENPSVLPSASKQPTKTSRFVQVDHKGLTQITETLLRKLNMVSYPFNLGVFFLEDAAWKRVRNIITPTFSSGKLRAMIPAINDCAYTLANNFSKTLNSKSVDMKEYFGAYTMDVIARTAFGVKVDSQNNFNDPFVSHAKKIFAPSPMRRPVMVIAGLLPFLMPLIRALGLSFFPKNVSDFFVKNITEMIKERRMDSKEKWTDFLQLLMDAEVVEGTEGDIQTVHGMTSSGDKQLVRRLTIDEIVGQGLLFFVAGYETTASTLNLASYCLATHPDVQEKAYQEIRDVLGDEEPDYENISKLRCLENVINETLRLYPPIVFIHRRATEKITIKGLTIPKGFSVYIPTFSIQRDPELFKDPQEFKPERFDEKINPLSFLAFGYGPRICIGMRLALVEAKIALVHVLRRVKFEKGPDTPEKMTFKSIAILQPKVPNKLKLSPRC